MSIFSIFSLGSDAPTLGRRKFLQGLLAAAPAAVAAAAAIDLSFVPEVQAAARDALRKLDEMVDGDLGLQSGRIMVAAPKTIFDPSARVWRSVANEAGAWADYVTAKTGVARPIALTACMRLARLVDDDLRTAQVTTESKIDVRLPEITRTWTTHRGEKQCEIGLGVHKDTLFDGTEQMSVKFKGVAPRLLDSNGKIFKMADQPYGAVDVTARLNEAPANADWQTPDDWDDHEDS